ncbi:alkene reductase [Pedobacter hiemivivus]|uniref:Alkene reductase n=1 Tax=Pedobacter hiemivivus TaxID=2530454 RepID=A0A4U1GEA2_9SPHI|nr:alkene reductase [Pedobacter hiemivivus]TKC62405.1 alkene reductase [Pedobacter hiemivivus]
MLFQPYELKGIHLKNRIVMPPMTRSRADTGEVATALMAEYYAQRASAGLIITEGTQISRQGQGYAWTPGIYTKEQIAGWKKVTAAVHANNGKIFAQLWHVGRVSHISLQANGQAPVSPSAIVAEGVKVFLAKDGGDASSGIGEMVQHSIPRELTVVEIHQIIEDYANAARNAVEAGFDGVELHGANGYLIEQFLDSQTNHRKDEYGGTLENRLRFLKEVTTAVADAIGPDKVGVRQAPLTTLMGAMDDHPEETYIAAAKILDALDISYIHIAEADWDNAPVMSLSFKEAYRQEFKGTLIYSGKYTAQRAEEALENGWADLIAFGRSFIANPDLPDRLKYNLPLNEPKREKFFGGGAEGYTDYPFYTDIFEPAALGHLQLKNRIAMAPMTRARNEDGVPKAFNVHYYAERSGAGLIITEGTAISATSKGVLHVPGLYTQEQVLGWQPVTEAVHADRARIFTQLWHVGRVSHTSNQPGGQDPVGASDIQAANSNAWGYDENGKEGFVTCSRPRALSADEVKDVVKDFAGAARNAISAGFDGVELHGANGYLIEQFLNPYTNDRGDIYGGSIENRSRFLLESIDACIDAIGADKVSIRLTPYGGLHEMPQYEEIEATYEYLAKELSAKNIAYIHIMDQQSRGSFALPDGFLERFRNWYNGVIILAGGMDKKKAEELINQGTIDIAAFGEPFISNPDLVDRLKNNCPLTQPTREFHYGLTMQGYLNWPHYQK